MNEVLEFVKNFGGNTQEASTVNQFLKEKFSVIAASVRSLTPIVDSLRRTSRSSRA